MSGIGYSPDMDNRHRAPRAIRIQRVRRTRVRPGVSWIMLGMLFVAAVLLSSPQFQQVGQDGPAPVRDLNNSVPAGSR